ncbi:lipopolysaccharide assembly protein LapB [Treponema sp. Marseille-Q3903]|jgi:tetratricopeptide repeat protein|uniref:tetratricopeptide repeat protein n=1 Tax=Treponema sp. Marseille-Q3903 TaxID=2766703 RepID=UPI0016520DBD|nr:tetratricopeptide repeat protein [Treponema sp. Marseille-Q3903]MBC6713817.1 tetratricopeptide repeat protein [Treponema sp. Marseille-Q3903]
MQNNILEPGIRMYSMKDYANSLAFFLSLPSDSEADKVEIAYYLGLCYAKLEKYDDALMFLEQVVTSGAQLERVLQCRFLLAVIYAISGRKRLADFELNKLLETGYMTASVYAAIAFVAWEQKDTDKCLSYYEKSLKTDPDNISSLNGLGYVLACEEKDLTRALSLCKQAVKVAPKSAACLDSLGWVYYKLGLYNDALQYLQQAEQIDTDSIEIANHIKTVMLEAKH